MSASSVPDPASIDDLACPCGFRTAVANALNVLRDVLTRCSCPAMPVLMLCGRTEKLMLPLLVVVNASILTFLPA